MKKLPLFVAVAALAFPAALLAKPAKTAKPGRASRAEAAKAPDFVKYDANKNGSIDADEYETIRKDFAADPKGALAKLDTNSDGKLSDDELAAFKPAPTKGKGDRVAKKPNAKRKKGAAEPAKPTETKPEEPAKKPEDPK